MWLGPQPDNCPLAQGWGFPGIQGRTQRLDSEIVKEEAPREFLGLVLAWLHRCHSTTRWRCGSSLRRLLFPALERVQGQPREQPLEQPLSLIIPVACRATWACP